MKASLISSGEARTRGCLGKITGAIHPSDAWLVARPDAAT